ncbi:MAG: ketopantoate reductase family protein [Gemmatimonas sp.]
MKIAIVGAGAIGCWIGARLASAGHEISVLARGNALTALRTHGLRLSEDGSTSVFAVNAHATADGIGPQQLVVVAVKSHSLRDVAPAIRALSQADTMVLPAMNGVPWWFANGMADVEPALLRVVDRDLAISRNVPIDQVIGCVVHANATLLEPGHARRNMGNGMIIGEARGGHSERATVLLDALVHAGIHATESTNIRQDVWYKLWGNMTMNPISAVTGATADRIINDVYVRSLLLAVMKEAAEIGERIGCPIVERGEDRIEVTRKLGAFRTSMLQDADAGRPLELDALLAAPHSIGHALGVPTPNMTALLGIARLYAETRGLIP